MEQVFVNYLRTLNIPVSRKYFQKLIASHPDYPSLLAVSDVFMQLRIPHSVSRIEKGELLKFPAPYILYLQKDEKKFTIVKDEKSLNVINELPDKWNGVVIKAEHVDNIEDDENRHFLRKEKTNRIGFGLLFISLLTLFVIVLSAGFSWPLLFLLTSAITGTLLGSLLVAKDLGVTMEAVDSFCNHGIHINCDRVLRSDHAKLIGSYSVSDLVLTYFIVQMIVIGFLAPVSSLEASLLWVLFVTAVIAIPFVGYSLWLQAVKFKTWCRLCLLVAVVLIVQVVLFGWMATTNMLFYGDASLWSVGVVWSLLLAAGSLEFLIKTHLKEGNMAEQTEVSINRIKYNPGVFSHLLLQEMRADYSPFEKELLIGKPEAPVKITMAASLGCAPCKDGFEKAAQLVDQWPEHVNLSVRFLMPNGENGLEGNYHPGETLLIGWLHHVYNKVNQSERTEGLIKDWYNSLHQGMFREKYPEKYPHESANGRDKTINSLIQMHTEWFKREGINKTPTFFVNGYTLPMHYRIEDLILLFPGLPEQLTSEIQHLQKRKVALPEM